MDYESTWRGKGIVDSAKTIEEMVSHLENAIIELKEMAQKGVVLEQEVSDDYAILVTDSEEVAREYGFIYLPREEE